MYPKQYCIRLKLKLYQTSESDQGTKPHENQRLVRVTFRFFVQTEPYSHERM